MSDANQKKWGELRRQPMQDLYCDDNGTTRFRENKIVSAFLEHGMRTGFCLNRLAEMRVDGEFSQDDYEQFSQLHGYSLKGFHELSGVSDDAALAASNRAVRMGLEDQGCRSQGCAIHIGVETK